MLVLGRKVGETIMIGDDIEIVVVAVEGEHVKLGIKAPREVSVYRGELYETIQKSNQLAQQQKVSLTQLNALFRKK
jgi:carbon storage regulator